LRSTASSYFPVKKYFSNFCDRRKLSKTSEAPSACSILGSFSVLLACSRAREDRNRTPRALENVRQAKELGVQRVAVPNRKGRDSARSKE
jgi:hypothetical protein